MKKFFSKFDDVPSQNRTPLPNFEDGFILGAAEDVVLGKTNLDKLKERFRFNLTGATFQKFNRLLLNNTTFHSSAVSSVII